MAQLESNKTLTKADDETHDEFFVRVLARRREFAASSDTWIEAPHMTKPNKPLARKDTDRPQPSPRTKSSGTSEDGEDEEF